MIRKFVAIPCAGIVRGAVVLAMILTGIPTASAQQTAPPADPQSQTQQQPDTQQPSIQETEPEVIKPKAKPHLFDKWAFNVGAGASLFTGTTQQFVRGGGGVGAVGVARNYSPYFGLRLDFQFNNLPLKSTALQAAQAAGATSHVYTLMGDLLFNLPVTKLWSGYFVGGGTFFHRDGKLDSSQALPGSPCNAFFTWWGPCFAGSLPLDGNFLHESQVQWGENFGAGIARKVTPKIEIYGEFRLLHGSRYNRTTDLRPITVGVRW